RGQQAAALGVRGGPVPVGHGVLVSPDPGVVDVPGCGRAVPLHLERSGGGLVAVFGRQNPYLPRLGVVPWLRLRVSIEVGAGGVMQSRTRVVGLGADSLNASAGVLPHGENDAVTLRVDDVVGVLGPAPPSEAFVFLSPEELAERLRES